MRRRTCASSPSPPVSPGPGEVRVAIEAGGICGSDLHYYNHGGFGTVRIKEPMVLGHEIAGRIVGGRAGRRGPCARHARRRQSEPPLRPLPLLPGGDAERMPRHALHRQRHAVSARAGRLPAEPDRRGRAGGADRRGHDDGGGGDGRAAGRLPARGRRPVRCWASGCSSPAAGRSAPCASWWPGTRARRRSSRPTSPITRCRSPRGGRDGDDQQPRAARRARALRGRQGHLRRAVRVLPATSAPLRGALDVVRAGRRSSCRSDSAAT